MQMDPHDCKNIYMIKTGSGSPCFFHISEGQELMIQHTFPFCLCVFKCVSIEPSAHYPVVQCVGVALC